MAEKTGFKVKDFKLNRSGIKTILQSDGMADALAANAANVGTGTVEQTFVGFDRVHVLVSTGEKK